MELKVLGQDGAAAAGGCASSGCGGSSDALAHLPEAIRAKVHNHPCYSEEAHHHYARMHVAVAPACNIQCHYCNRKYDCANESRPGVVSEVLTPDQAVKKVMAVAANIPQMTVLGIAGPGDPLANPARTLETFRQLSEKAPDIKLCVSTNGLALPAVVDELCKHNIDHVTITINCVDPDVGAKIYPWIFWNNRRIKGRKGAEILIEQQQKGLEMLVARGVLVKVNSVMIPGVNDEHLKEVSRVVKAKGAFLHNVMPLIAEAEHGTFFGVMGQRGPTHGELQTLQDACAGDMAMMRHCRQCRADAVGMLGEDRGDEFTLDKIESMEIDYAQAMEQRRQVHATIEANREAQRKKSGETFISHCQPQGTEAGDPPGADGGGDHRRRGHQPALRPRPGVPDLRGQHPGRALHRRTARWTSIAPAATPAGMRRRPLPRPSGRSRAARRCCAPRSAMSPGGCWRRPALRPTASTPWSPSRRPSPRCIGRWPRTGAWTSRPPWNCA